MGLILLSGYMKAEVGSQVAPEAPQPSQSMRNFQPCLSIRGGQHLPQRSIRRLQSLRRTTQRDNTTRVATQHTAAIKTTA